MTVLRADGELEASGSYQQKKRIAEAAIKASAGSGETLYMYQNERGNWNYSTKEEQACKGHDRNGEVTAPVVVKPDDFRPMWKIGIDGDKVKENLNIEKGAV